MMFMLRSLSVYAYVSRFSRRCASPTDRVRHNNRLPWKRMDMETGEGHLAMAVEGRHTGSVILSIGWNVEVVARRATVHHHVHDLDGGAALFDCGWSRGGGDGEG